MRTVLKNLVLSLITISIVIPPHISAQGKWIQIAQPTTSDLFKLSFLDTARGWACGSDGVIIKTTDGGVTWITLETGTRNMIKDIFMLDGNKGWAISWKEFQDTLSFFGTIMLTTSNGGDSWTNTEFPVRATYFHSILFLDSLNGWLGGEGGALMRTIDGGKRWTPAVVDSSIFTGWPILNINFFSRLLGFAMGGRMDFVGVIWRTTNGGDRWTPESISPEPIYELHFVDSMNIIGIVGDWDFGASIIRSSDGGEQWEYTYLGIFGQPRTMDFRTPSEGWVPLGNQLMITTDTARTWYIQEILGHRTIYDLVFVDSTIGYAVGDSGFVFKYSYKPTGVENYVSPRPATFQLTQNYPNPFNPHTTIEFALQTAAPVSLDVYDVLGASVRSILQNVSMLVGPHQVLFDAGDLPSGIYLYRLSVGGRTSTKKMLLLK